MSLERLRNNQSFLDSYNNFLIDEKKECVYSHPFGYIDCVLVIIDNTVKFMPIIGRPQELRSQEMPDPKNFSVWAGQSVRKLKKKCKGQVAITEIWDILRLLIGVSRETYERIQRESDTIIREVLKEFEYDYKNYKFDSESVYVTNIDIAFRDLNDIYPKNHSLQESLDVFRSEYRKSDEYIYRDTSNDPYFEVVFRKGFIDSIYREGRKISILERFKNNQNLSDSFMNFLTDTNESVWQPFCHISCSSMIVDKDVKLMPIIVRPQKLRANEMLNPKNYSILVVPSENKKRQNEWKLMKKLKKICKGQKAFTLQERYMYPNQSIFFGISRETYDRIQKAGDTLIREVLKEIENEYEATGFKSELELAEAVDGAFSELENIYPAVYDWDSICSSHDSSNDSFSDDDYSYINKEDDTPGDFQRLWDSIWDRDYWEDRWEDEFYDDYYDD